MKLYLILVWETACFAFSREEEGVEKISVFHKYNNDLSYCVGGIVVEFTDMTWCLREDRGWPLSCSRTSLYSIASNIGLDVHHLNEKSLMHLIKDPPRECRFKSLFVSSIVLYQHFILHSFYCLWYLPPSGCGFKSLFVSSIVLYQQFILYSFYCLWYLLNEHNVDRQLFKKWPNPHQCKLSTM